MNETPAGWYDDGSGRRRWWDGSVWTDEFLETEPPAPTAAAEPARRSKVPLIAGLAVAVLTLGAAGAAVAVVLTASSGDPVAPDAPPVAIDGTPSPVAEPLEPGDVVLAYDRAYKEIDCELWLQVTTDAYRQHGAGCDEFEADAPEHLRHRTDYVIEINRVSIEGAEAYVITSDAYVIGSDHYTGEQLFKLVDVDGQWRVEWSEPFGAE